ncbi:PQQ-binding-like beta-propeller repeat protein [Streptomyces sp. NPDC004647]|uniref:protein kinase domain-containing protein n=1 Tax=Streptomyces sp. NPDC004647 TaxID=3154671 RepID=UPI0033B2B28E
MPPLRGTGAGPEAEDPEYAGQYRLEARLGSGGMGVVHLARSTSGLRLAVKVVHADFAGDDEFRARFRQEVAAARRVSGAFTAPVVDADPDAVRPWMATLYIPGPTLAQHVKRNGPLAPPEVRRLAAGLAEALRDIHRAGVVHRDLKPGNVLLAEDGPKVIDFGISRPSDSDLRTETGKLIGTPPFMAPEQFQRPRSVGPAADVFALGSVLVHAATGRGPFDSESPYIVAYQVVHDEADLAGVPEGLAPLISSCLAKDPEDRPTPDAVMAMLRGLASAEAGEAGASWAALRPGAGTGTGAGPGPRPVPGPRAGGTAAGRVPQPRRPSALESGAAAADWPSADGSWGSRGITEYPNSRLDVDATPDPSARSGTADDVAWPDTVWQPGADADDRRQAERAADGTDETHAGRSRRAARTDPETTTGSGRRAEPAVHTGPTEPISGAVLRESAESEGSPRAVQPADGAARQASRADGGNRSGHPAEVLGDGTASAAGPPPVGARPTAARWRTRRLRWIAAGAAVVAVVLGASIAGAVRDPAPPGDHDRERKSSAAPFRPWKTTLATAGAPKSGMRAPFCTYAGGALHCATVGVKSARLDPSSGRRVWSRGQAPPPPDGSIPTAPVPCDGLLHVMSADGTRLEALDPASGRTRWSKAVSSYAGRVYHAGDKVLLVSGDGTVRALRGATGREDWRQRFSAHAAPVFSPYADERTAYAVSTHGDGSRTLVSAVDTATGELRWEHRLSGTLTPLATGNDGALLLTSSDLEQRTDAIVRYDPERRRERRIPLALPLPSAAAAAHGDTVHLLAYGGTLMAVDTRRTDAGSAELWRMETSVSNASQLTVTDGRLYFTAADGRLLAVDTRRGVLIGQTPPRMNAANRDYTADVPAPVVAGGKVFAAAPDGTIFGVGADAPSRW